MKFDSVPKILTWYFSKRWQRGPRRVQSLDLTKVRCPRRAEDTEGFIKAYLSVSQTLDTKLKPRTFLILQNEFGYDGKTQVELASEYNLSSDRSIRDIRDRALKKLKKEFLNTGVLSKPKYEEPVYIHE